MITTKNTITFERAVNVILFYSQKFYQIMDSNQNQKSRAGLFKTIAKVTSISVSAGV